MMKAKWIQRWTDQEFMSMKEEDKREVLATHVV